MNKETIKTVERKILKEMQEDENSLRRLLVIETNGIPDEQLDGLFVKIQQQLGRVATNQNKLILLQDITDE